jgi:hypothetical protein
VDSVDNPCFRRSTREFLSTGPVGNPVGNLARLWTNEAVPRFSTLRPQLRPQVFPRFSTGLGGSVVGCPTPASTGTGVVTHRLGALFHRLSTGLSTDLTPLLWITSVRERQNFFPAPSTEHPNPDKGSVHRFVHRAPPVLRAEHGHDRVRPGVGWATAAPEGPENRENEACRARTAPNVGRGGEPPQRRTFARTRLWITRSEVGRSPVDNVCRLVAVSPCGRVAL